MIKLFKYLKPFAISVIAAIILVFLQSLSELKLPDLMSEIVDTGIVKGDTGFIWKTGVVMLFVALGGTVCTFFATLLSSRASSGLGRDLRRRVFSHIESFGLQEFDKFGTASLITRTTNDIQHVQMVLLMTLRMVVSAPIMCIGGIIMAVRKDTRLSLILIASLPIIAGIIIMIARKAVPLYKIMQTKLDRLNLVLRENLTGIRVIRAFNRTEHEKKRFSEANLELTNTTVKVNRVMAALMPAMMLVLNYTTIAIIWFGGHRIDAGQMQVGDMMAFIQYAMQILMALIMFSVIFVMLPRAAASADRINEVLDTAPVIYDEVTESSSYVHKGYVEFKDVTFKYPGAEKPAIKNISFAVKPGETTAIIGGTGSGKSTIINLLLRFYDASSGHIIVNGVDIRQMRQDELRSKIGYVPQKSVLFSGTISDNISYGKNAASADEIKAAAETAQAMEFINDMKDGFDSLISQGGTNISGGQKQRLSIARALVRKPEIYVFDDSFSALDFRTDARLRAALSKELGDAAVIVIAQRVSTIMDADNIIVIDNGIIVDIGKHKDLVKGCEIYREIVLSQLSEEALA